MRRIGTKCQSDPGHLACLPLVRDLRLYGSGIAHEFIICEDYQPKRIFPTPFILPNFSMGTQRNIARFAEEISGSPMKPGRGVYTLTIREDYGTADVLNRLKRFAPKKNSIHIGWGSLRNLDIVAARQPQYALICDINQYQLNIWSVVRQALLNTKSAEQCLRLLAKILPRNPPLRQFAESTEDWLLGDMSRPESWLFQGAPDRFEHVRSLFLNDAIGFACLDIRGEKTRAKAITSPALIRLKKWLSKDEHDCRIHVDTVYVSNIPHALKGEQDFYYRSNDEWLVQLFDQDGERYWLSAYERMWCNLAELCNKDTFLVIAEYLYPTGDDDLQWVTETGPFFELMRQHLNCFYQAFPDRKVKSHAVLNVC